ncbi:hypothetical protein WL29_36555 [Burkholderia ubonensis]|uniref:Uncharacterized protein n=1 Tax=Burkholderia ubonensis TaxID=101571 RepID=A0A118U0F1_9BURK|nr:hypothetical protein WJ31_08090 [Burkholderia ubonensis]KVO98997.1 hypothetical protein WJ81_31070 [Burkholderia ubonensis]KVP56487.1 hypothetical protein WJ91_00735 [Burkholderia ubonensis]KVP79704.1 hypothetical protein WJ93_31115 [Burkholderia ubonensis]KVZ62739.1 hypothetical protein WL20_13765 [Burkholderia ubonensis]
MKGCAALARPAGVKEISCEVIFQEYRHVGAGVADDLFGLVDFFEVFGEAVVDAGCLDGRTRDYSQRPEVRFALIHDATSVTGMVWR